MTQQFHYWAYNLRKPQFKKTQIPTMFIAALFTTVRTGKQARYASTDERIKKIWYIHTTEHHSATKSNRFESVLMRRMKLETTAHSEMSQKNKHHILVEQIRK